MFFFHDFLSYNNSACATNFPLTPMIPDVLRGGENEFAVVLTAGTRPPPAALC